LVARGLSSAGLILIDGGAAFAPSTGSRHSRGQISRYRPVPPAYIVK
jgi:hypothetical protein